MLVSDQPEPPVGRGGINEILCVDVLIGAANCTMRFCSRPVRSAKMSFFLFFFFSYAMLII